VVQKVSPKRAYEASFLSFSLSAKQLTSTVPIILQRKLLLNILLSIMHDVMRAVKRAWLDAMPL